MRIVRASWGLEAIVIGLVACVACVACHTTEAQRAPAPTATGNDVPPGAVAVSPATTTTTTTTHAELDVKGAPAVAPANLAATTTSTSTSATSTTSTTTATTAGALPARSAGCGRGGARARAYRAKIARPEGDRTYEVRLPAHYDPDVPAPLVFAFHPFGGSATAFLDQTGLDVAAGARGYVTVAPNGVNQSFNAGDCCGSARAKNVDDVATVGAILDDLEASLCLDPHRVYATGFSNGGFMSFAVACGLSDRIAAIQTVGSVMGVRQCDVKRPVSVVMLNGVGDDVIPPKGGGPYHTEPVAASLAGWAQRDRCTSPPVETKVHQATRCTHFDCEGGAMVESCIVPYAHIWMDRLAPPRDDGSKRRVANAALDFFAAHPIP